MLSVHKTLSALMAMLFLLFLSLLTAAECHAEELNEGLQGAADALAPRDIVTGKRLLNTETEAAEIQRAEKQQIQILTNARSSGFGVDTDQVLLSHLQEMLQRIAKVSHRPNLPWEVHLIESPEVNAFTIGGGKIFFYRGLFGGLVDPSSDNEIAAVMAHEMGHDAARHVSKTQSEQLLSHFSKKTRDPIYKASFSTLQEDEADRIGLLYMSMAGYNPNVVSSIWLRANQKYGSNPNDFNFAYDHSLHFDRAKKTWAMTPAAQEYFLGQNIVNSNYKNILVSNDLIHRENTHEGDNAYTATVDAVLDNATQQLRARNEQLSRQLKMQQEQNAARQLTNIDFQIGNTSTGYQAILGRFQNGSNLVITGATVTVYYLNAAGQSIYSEAVQMPGNYIPPGQIVNWSTYVKTVPGAPNIRAGVTAVNWAE